MKRSTEKEMMDLPGNPREILEEDLQNLRTINRYLGGYRTVLHALKLLASEQKMTRFSLLDVGTGSGDIPRTIAQWARRNRVDARIVALEVEPVTVEQAGRETGNFSEIAVVRADGTAPPFRPLTFDFVLSSQVLHHFPEDTIIGLLKSWSRLARRAIIVSDLVRDPLAYFAIRGITLLLTRNPMTRIDAPLSVRRAFTLKEWRDLFARAAVGPFRLFPMFPYRHLTIITVSK